MDIIITNAARVDVGVVDNCALDLAYGSGENDFELTFAYHDAPAYEIGAFFYIEDTEFAGIIDKVTSSTIENKVTYSGRSLTGILASRIIAPDAGQAYYSVSGNLGTVINTVLARIGLSSIFGTCLSDVTTSTFQFNRYVNAYDGLAALAKVNGQKLVLAFHNGLIRIGVQPIADYSYTDTLDSGILRLKAAKGRGIKKLICLGKGDLAARLVVPLYVQPNGSIAETAQTLTAYDREEVYDYPNAEERAELVKYGTERLQELITQDKLEAKLPADDDVEFSIGDVVGGYDAVLDITVAKRVTKKIVKVQGGRAEIEYEVGD